MPAWCASLYCQNCWISYPRKSSKFPELLLFLNQEIFCGFPLQGKAETGTIKVSSRKTMCQNFLVGNLLKISLHFPWISLLGNSRILAVSLWIFEIDIPINHIIVISDQGGLPIIIHDLADNSYWHIDFLQLSCRCCRYYSYNISNLLLVFSYERRRRLW